jgi:hypothetical protein
MRSLLCMVLAGVVLGSAAAAADEGRRGRDDGRYVRYERHRNEGRRDYDNDDRHHRGYGKRGGYVSVREVHVIREYYRPRYKRLPPGHAKRYYRNAYLPHGWEHRFEPIPVYVERELVVLPHGYRRGLIDGHVVVLNQRGLIIDVAVLF